MFVTNCTDIPLFRKTDFYLILQSNFILAYLFGPNFGRINGEMFVLKL